MFTTCRCGGVLDAVDAVVIEDTERPFLFQWWVPGFRCRTCRNETVHRDTMANWPPAQTPTVTLLDEEAR